MLLMFREIPKHNILTFILVFLLLHHHDIGFRKKIKCLMLHKLV